MRGRTSSLLALTVFLVSGIAGAQGRQPQTVSPGGTGAIVDIEASCPTFSWGLETGAKSYELVVYRISGDGGPPAAERPGTKGRGPAIKQVVAGTALSWTPSLTQCLERSESYAWSLRAVKTNGARPWSKPRLFRVAAAPSVHEVEEALSVLRRYVASAGTEPGGAPAEHPAREAGGPEAEEVAAPETPDAKQGGSVSFVVDSNGDVSGGGFFGSGAGLSSVDASLFDGRASSTFANKTHGHSPNEVMVGTDQVLLGPVVLGYCAGSTTLNSSCNAQCPVAPQGFEYQLIGGGCRGNGIVCASEDVVITASYRADKNNYICSVTCLDGAGTTQASGNAICAPTQLSPI